MRSPSEILFRLRQEAENLRLYLSPPSKAPSAGTIPLPPPSAIAEKLRGTPFAEKLTSIAEQILERRLPLLGYQIDTGPETHWRRDYIHDRETSADYFRRIPYLDFARAGDHKIVWELNRHQHLVAMLQADLLNPRANFPAEAFTQLESWLDQNPVCLGINWASALEVAFRALSWIWIHHLAADRMPEPLRTRWLLSLYHHGCYLEHNLSIYFSPNTHLQGEALALHALGLLFGVERWRALGTSQLRQMMRDHVNPDGGHFEQSSFYHVYATDMFLFHAVLETPDAEYADSLRRMACYLWALGGSGQMPMFGDDDGGRLFYPYGDRDQFARATLAACASFLGDTPSHGDPDDLDEIAVWWLGEGAKAHPASIRTSELFPETGVATMMEGDVELIASVRAFGRGSAGHSHAHSLHFTLRHAGEQVLVDPGTYTYVSDPAWRERFRGTSAHNTLAIDSLDQADPAGPFRWSNLPVTEILRFEKEPWRLDARCTYRGISHTREIFFSQGLLMVVDRVSGTGRHRIDQFWHSAGPISQLPDGSIQLPGKVRLIAENRKALIEDGWRSPLPGVRHPSPVIRFTIEAELPQTIVTAFEFVPRSA